MGGVVWLNFGLVGLFGGRIMLKSFKAIGITYHALSSQCPFAAFKLWEFIVCILLRNGWWNLVEISHMIIWGLHKKFHQQWIEESGTPFTKLHSAPTDK